MLVRKAFNCALYFIVSEIITKCTFTEFRNKNNGGSSLQNEAFIMLL